MFFKRIRSFIYGVRLPLVAAQTILKDKGLLILSLLPVVITLFLYFYLMGTLNQKATDFLRAHQYWGASTGSWIAWLIDLTTKIVLILVGAFTFAFASSMVASPFNDFLAERAERHSSPPLPPVTQVSILGKIKLVALDLFKAIAAGIATLLALLLSLIPVLNVAAFFLAFLLVAFQFTSYPQTRRGMGFKKGLLFLWQHLWACLGFGASLSCLFAIPLFSCFMLPLAVVGGTLLVGRAPGAPKQGLHPLK